jgi:hypothetical protein
MLLSRGYEVQSIGRAAKDNSVNSFVWDVAAQQMDARALDGVDAIIHLAGAGVADQRWTTARKKEILNSRIDSTRLLYNTLTTRTHQVKTIISASAVGYYGDCGDEILREDHSPAHTFLAEVTDRWEKEVARFQQEGIRHVCCRIGIVLAEHGGALPELVKTLPLGIAGYFAKAPLYYPWVHIDDVCGIMIHALENQNVHGSYNATAPHPVSIKDLMRALLMARKSKAILTPIPGFALRLALGEMSEMLLSSQNCSSEKIIRAGYKFKFPGLQRALADIYPS